MSYGMKIEKKLNGNGMTICLQGSLDSMTAPELKEALNENQQKDMWENLSGYNYSCLMRVCDHPGRAVLFTEKNEYGWDGWLGTYFANLPDRGITFLLAQNVTDTGTAPVTRKCRNILAACMDC